MHRQITWMAILAVALAVSTALLSVGQQDFARDFLLALFGVFLSIGIGLVIVNVFLDKKSRQIAAGPLMRLVGEPIARYHNELFIEPGRSKFGIPEYNRIADAYNASRSNPQVFSQEERRMLDEIVEDNVTEILDCISDMDSKLSDLVSVLGWSYDAEIIAAALTCKRNISGFRGTARPQNDKEKLQRIEYYIDIDTSSAHVLLTLSKIYGVDDLFSED